MFPQAGSPPAGPGWSDCARQVTPLMASLASFSVVMVRRDRFCSQTILLLNACQFCFSDRLWRSSMLIPVNPEPRSGGCRDDRL